VWRCTTAATECRISAGSDVIGVNNRDLTTFEVTLETSLRLAEHIPPACCASAKAAHDARDIASAARGGLHRLSGGPSIS